MNFQISTVRGGGNHHMDEHGHKTTSIWVSEDKLLLFDCNDLTIVYVLSKCKIEPVFTNEICPLLMPFRHTNPDPFCL